MDAMLNGLGGLPAILTVNRVAVGCFFALSGYHKLFNKTRHASMLATLEADHIPEPRANAWFVSSVEFLGGLGVIAGLLAPLAALGLLTISMVATCTDGLRRIPGYAPLDKGDYACDVLYLPEVLYCIMLAAVIAAGAGPYSLDALLWR